MLPSVMAIDLPATFILERDGEMLMYSLFAVVVACQCRSILDQHLDISEVSRLQYLSEVQTVLWLPGETFSISSWAKKALPDSRNRDCLMRFRIIVE